MIERKDGDIDIEEMKKELGVKDSSYNYNDNKNTKNKSNKKEKGKKDNRKGDYDEEDNDDNSIEKPKREYPLYKYSNKGKGPLCESIILNGFPIFLIYENNEKIRLEDFIEEPNRIITPPSLEEYAYEPYEFTNEDELQEYFNKLKT